MMCVDCGTEFDLEERQGACPHVQRDSEMTRMLRFNREHPAYTLRHAHDFSGYRREHAHYVNRGAETDERYHRHPVLEERYARARIAADTGGKTR